MVDVVQWSCQLEQEFLSSSQNKPAAIAFIEYLHSTNAQEHFTNTVFEFPLVPGITPNALLPEIDSLKLS